jgi:hypothetical protein
MIHQLPAKVVRRGTSKRGGELTIEDGEKEGDGDESCQSQCERESPDQVQLHRCCRSRAPGGVKPSLL